MKRACVTGGAGHIGSHLVERLLASGWQVRVVDDFSTGRRENLSHLADDERLTVIEGRVQDSSCMADACRDVDAVYHLAAAVGVKLVVAEPVRTLETNIRGAEAALEAASRARARFFLASSSEVYGKSERVPFDEDDDLVIGSPRHMRWGYACSKAVGEFLAAAHAQAHDLPVVIGRIFNTIGPRQVGDYGMVVPRMVRAALAGEPIEVYGSGEQTRAFIDVRDTVEAIHRLTEAAGAGLGIYNIGGDSEVTINSLARLVLEEVRRLRVGGAAGGNRPDGLQGRTAADDSGGAVRRISYEEAYGRPIDEMMRRLPRVDRARAVLGADWPRYDLRASLREIIENHQCE